MAFKLLLDFYAYQGLNIAASLKQAKKIFLWKSGWGGVENVWIWRQEMENYIFSIWEREKIVFVRSDILFQQPLLPFGRSAPSIRPNNQRIWPQIYHSLVIIKCTIKISRKKSGRNSDDSLANVFALDFLLATRRRHQSAITSFCTRNVLFCVDRVVSVAWHGLPHHPMSSKMTSSSPAQGFVYNNTVLLNTCFE